ncbi:ATP-binding cassette domain-containing protein [Moritella viscosa]|uniref:ABC transporter, ATP-binding protein n=1 Tax=Moritella viscosa TaxID=80854 RepID=A0ABY1HHD4_9GAMM|nr:ABC transporter, ATP-binding protein [Moritella viscosa]SHO27564.1 ABC transporter, ATP-binding protein [Moritella viscosa]
MTIEFSDFSFKYASQDKATLKGINLRIEKGEKIVIIGPSGSGKSTLGQCLNGLFPPCDKR